VTKVLAVGNRTDSSRRPAAALSAPALAIAGRGQRSAQRRSSPTTWLNKASPPFGTSCLTALKRTGQSILVIDKDIDALIGVADHYYVIARAATSPGAERRASLPPPLMSSADISGFRQHDFG
jgi:hypothetical protein